MNYCPAFVPFITAERDDQIAEATVIYRPLLSRLSVVAGRSYRPTCPQIKHSVRTAQRLKLGAVQPVSFPSLTGGLLNREIPAVIRAESNPVFTARTNDRGRWLFRQTHQRAATADTYRCVGAPRARGRPHQHRGIDFRQIKSGGSGWIDI